MEENEEQKRNLEKYHQILDFYQKNLNENFPNIILQQKPLDRKRSNNSLNLHN
jgi:hypothetical protein